MKQSRKSYEPCEYVRDLAKQIDKKYAEDVAILEAIIKNKGREIAILRKELESLCKGQECDEECSYKNNISNK